MIGTYLMATFAAAFAASSLFTWIYAVEHVDPPADAAKTTSHERQTAA